MLDTKLETLLAVAEYKNLTKAAEMLSLTQPAVSNHINMLEKECNAKLFLRGKRDVVLTNEGKIAVTYARRLKALHEKMLQKISDEQKHVSRLRVGITHTSENNKITEVFGRYASEYSKATITIITDTINNLYEMLENYELDIAIVDGKRNSNKLNYLMLDTDYLVCVLSNDNPLSKKSMITVAELKRQSLILRLQSSATRQLFEATLTGIGENIADFNVSLEVDNVATIKDLVKKDLGVSILPQSACISDARKGKLSIIPIENLSMTREMNIAYGKDFNYPDILSDIARIYKSMVK